MHRLFRRTKSQRSELEAYIRRVLYMHKSDMEDTFSTNLFSPQELSTKVEQFGVKPNDYFLQTINTSCAVFLYNKKKNRYERVQRRFMENDIVCALRPVASITINQSQNGRFVEQGKHGTKIPYSQKIHAKVAVGDHWLPQYVYHYTVQS